MSCLIGQLPTTPKLRPVASYGWLCKPREKLNGDRAN